MLQPRDPATRKNLETYLKLVKERHPLVGQPVTHENGFIQVPVGEFARLHVWPDEEIEKQRSDSPIHDHTFSFRSWVLYGVLSNLMYDVQPQTTDFGTRYEIHTVNLEGKLVPTDTHANPILTSRQALRAGSMYEFRYGNFHETTWGDLDLAVSLMVKTGKAKEGVARVLHPHSQIVDNEFDRKKANDPALLWKIIDRGIDHALTLTHIW